MNKVIQKLHEWIRLKESLFKFKGCTFVSRETLSEEGGWGYCLFFTDGDVLLDGVAFWQLGFRLQQSYWNFRDFGSQKILVSKDLKIGTCFLNSPNSRIFAYNDDLPKRLFIVDAWSEMTKFGPRKLTFVPNLPLGCGLTDPNRL